MRVWEMRCAELIALFVWRVESYCTRTTRHDICCFVEPATCPRQRSENDVNGEGHVAAVRGGRVLGMRSGLDWPSPSVYLVASHAPTAPTRPFVNISRLLLIMPRVYLQHWERWLTKAFSLLHKAFHRKPHMRVAKWAIFLADLSSPHVPIHWGKCGRLQNYIGETYCVHENATSYVHTVHNTFK